MYIHTTNLTQHSEQDIRALFPNTSFPNPFVPPAEYVYIFPAPSNHDSATHTATPTTPELTVKGTWEQRWTLTPLPEEVIAANAAQAVKATKLSQIAALEATITPRRNREALLTDAGREWLAGVDLQIAVLRASL